LLQRCTPNRAARVARFILSIPFILFKRTLEHEELTGRSAGSTPSRRSAATARSSPPLSTRSATSDGTTSGATRIGGVLDGSASGPVGERPATDPYFAEKVCAVSIAP